MKDRIDQIIVYQAEYWGSTLYEAIMAVADVSDLDNEELDALERRMMQQTSPHVGDVVLAVVEWE